SRRSPVGGTPSSPAHTSETASTRTASPRECAQRRRSEWPGEVSALQRDVDPRTPWSCRERLPLRRLLLPARPGRAAGARPTPQGLLREPPEPRLTPRSRPLRRRAAEGGGARLRRRSLGRARGHAGPAARARLRL